MKSSFRPLIRGLSISSSLSGLWNLFLCVSVPSSGDYQFLLNKGVHGGWSMQFPSPHPGIINFFVTVPHLTPPVRRFRPLIRGLSISSHSWPISAHLWAVSVPSSGDYQFLHRLSNHCTNHFIVSVPSSGDYQFLPSRPLNEYMPPRRFRPLIRGLSISSLRIQLNWSEDQVSVPSSGDYQFLLTDLN